MKVPLIMDVGQTKPAITDYIAMEKFSTFMKDEERTSLLEAMLLVHQREYQKAHNMLESLAEESEDLQWRSLSWQLTVKVLLSPQEATFKTWKQWYADYLDRYNLTDKIHENVNAPNYLLAIEESASQLETLIEFDRANQLLWILDDIYKSLNKRGHLRRVRVAQAHVLTQMGKLDLAYDELAQSLSFTCPNRYVRRLHAVVESNYREDEKEGSFAMSYVSKTLLATMTVLACKKDIVTPKDKVAFIDDVIEAIERRPFRYMTSATTPIENDLESQTGSTSYDGENILEGFRCFRDVFMRTSLLRPVSTSAHSGVFRIGEYIYKTGNFEDIHNERYILTYFMNLCRGGIWLDNVSESLHLGRTSVVCDDAIAIPDIGHTVATIKRVPPHVEKRIGTDGNIQCLGKIPGMTLEECLQDPCQDNHFIYALAIDNLAALHAYGPKHLLEKIPIVPKQDAEGTIESHRERTKHTGFSKEDWEIVLEVYDPVAQGIQNRSIDVSVKDANVRNWIVTNDGMTAIDFELVFLSGPQWDLVKVLEHSYDRDIESKHDLVREYCSHYNRHAHDFNRLTPDEVHKQVISDVNKFIQTYEFFVIDHCIKSVHNPHYEGRTYLTHKRDWMQRGMDSIGWLTGCQEFLAEDIGKLDTLKHIFVKYRDQTSTRIAS